MFQLAQTDQVVLHLHQDQAGYKAVLPPEEEKIPNLVAAVGDVVVKEESVEVSAQDACTQSPPRKRKKRGGGGSS